jgi:epoxyqueuosine reductase QueG
MQRDLKDALRERAERMEIPLIGVADADRWREPLFEPWVPEEFFPQAIYPEARSVIVIGLPVHLPALETAPSIWYHELYATVNALLDQYTYRLANFLNEKGYPSVAVPRDGYGSISVLIETPIAFFSHRHAAVLAGLGRFGANNVVLTPEYGPRVRFGSVFTAAEIPPDPLIAGELCTRCMLCMQMCPSKAIDGEEYPKGLIDKGSCAGQSAALTARSAAPCGICIKVCPVGEDRKLYQREDLSIYRHPEKHPKYRDAWEHVRRYGLKKP